MSSDRDLIRHGDAIKALPARILIPMVCHDGDCYIQGERSVIRDMPATVSGLCRVFTVECIDHSDDLGPRWEAKDLVTGKAIVTAHPQDALAALADALTEEEWVR